MATNPNMEAIETITVGATSVASITFSNIPQTYTDLVLKVSARSDRTGSNIDGFYLFFNSDTTLGNYTGRRVYGNGASAVSDTYQGVIIEGNDQTSSTFGSAEIYIPNYRGSNNKSYSADAVNENNATTAFAALTGGLWSNTSAITNINLRTEDGVTKFLQHSSATLYGVTNAAVGAKATGGTITSDANYFYHTFLASGTFTPTQSLTADCLVVGGGGGATYGRTGTYYGAPGGGANVQTFNSQSLTAQNYTVTIGAGGGGAGSALDVNGSNGNPSQFGSLSAVTGGYGAVVTTGYGGTSGNGNLGGAPNGASTGGGGGAGAVGTNATGAGGGTGGNGATSSLINEFGIATGSGELVSGNYYFGGGGGGSLLTGGGGLGGFGGAGDSRQAGTANTGGGAGGGEYATFPGLGGGSGIVIVRYAK